MFIPGHGYFTKAVQYWTLERAFGAIGNRSVYAKYS